MTTTITVLCSGHSNTLVEVAYVRPDAKPCPTSQKVGELKAGEHKTFTIYSGQDIVVTEKVG